MPATAKEWVGISSHAAGQEQEVGKCCPDFKDKKEYPETTVLSVSLQCPVKIMEKIRVTVIGVTSDWGPVTCHKWGSARLLPQALLFGIFIHDLDKGRKGILSKFADYTEFGGAVDSLKGRETSKNLRDGQSPTI